MRHVGPCLAKHRLIFLACLIHTTLASYSCLYRERQDSSEASEISCQRECCGGQIPVGRDQACCNDQPPRPPAPPRPTQPVPPATSRPPRKAGDSDDSSSSSSSSPPTWIVIPAVIMSLVLVSAVLIFVCHCYNQKSRVGNRRILNGISSRQRHRNRLHPHNHHDHQATRDSPCPPYVDSAIAYSTASHLVDLTGPNLTASDMRRLSRPPVDFLPDYETFMSRVDFDYQSRFLNEITRSATASVRPRTSLPAGIQNIAPLHSDQVDEPGFQETTFNSSFVQAVVSDFESDNEAS